MLGRSGSFWQLQSESKCACVKPCSGTPYTDGDRSRAAAAACVASLALGVAAVVFQITKRQRQRKAESRCCA